MGSLLCLPNANVDVERVFFSSVNLIKTKIRNRLHTKTVGALLKVKRGVAKGGGCMNFTPPPGAKARMTACTLCTQFPIQTLIPSGATRLCTFIMEQ